MPVRTLSAPERAALSGGPVWTCPNRVYISYTLSMLGLMSTPVTTRLDDETVAALDRAVDAGLAQNRGAVISAAVRSWLSEHSEEAIVASYRRRYATPVSEADELVSSLAAFSVAACLAASDR